MLFLLFTSLIAHAQDLSHRLPIIERAVVEDKAARELGMAERFVGVTRLNTSLVDIEAQGLNSGRTNVTPWSGYFWPNYVGGLAFRWVDPAFPRNNWGAANNYVAQIPWNRAYREYLSPAEKYDLAMGMNPQEAGSLTAHQWNLGRNEFQTTGTVATWQGICHGWSPASVFLPNPVRPVWVGQVLFTVDDIKALGSLYWANASYETVYAGWRCNETKPEVDSEGRPMDARCFDVNPADWHLVLSYLIGQQKRPFIIDAERKSQVWNKPVVSYRMEYFDVADHRVKSNQFRDVVRRRDHLGRLRFGTYRAPQTVWVVGVRSIVSMGDGQNPGVHVPDSQMKTYTYDLELDDNYNVIGGEWRGELNPDFLWRPEFDIAPTSAGDNTRVDVRRIGDQSWRNAARQSSARGVPLKALIDYLYQNSQL